MYCPKCGKELTSTPDQLFCEYGKLKFSQNLSKRLWECYVAELRMPAERQFNFSIGGQWFYPACGIETKAENGFVRCPKCNRTLNKFMFALIEHHPHYEPISGKWI